MRISSRTMRPGEGTNPSPVRRRLEKAPSPDTLSPRERATCQSTHPRCPAEDTGNDQPQGRGLHVKVRTLGVQPKIRVTISPKGEG